MKIVVDVIVLIFLYFLVFYKKWKKLSNYDLFIRTIMYVYISFVLYFTLMPIICSIPFMFNHPFKMMNMNLFDDLLNHRGDYIRQIVLNIVMLIPFGIIFPMIDKKNNFVKTVKWSFITSLVIELLQTLISVRSSDITDLITNVFGAVIGYLIYLIFKPFINKIFNKVFISK